VNAFFDTNVFVYAFTEGPKQGAARMALADGGATSVQVLNELVNVLRKKYRKSWLEIETAHAIGARS
jgi:predicted nucleic acid-binding protein